MAKEQGGGKSKTQLEQERRTWWERPARILAPIALLAILFLQLYMGARNKSATLDEQNHIARGLAFLRTGDVRLSLIHPPLV
ncbi:MAG: hypothetical protein ACREDR_44550, partial [Blastocatellia bacterium]